MKRIVVPELLDDDLGTDREISKSLADLHVLNRFFGGAAATTFLLRKVARRQGLRKLTWLDVAGATGDIALRAQAALRQEGITIEPTILDRKVTHLAKTAPSVCGSAFQLPFRDQSFDVVGCSLFLHHLEEDDISRFLREAMRCCRRAVIVNDLRRDRLHWLAAIAGRLIYQSPITAHDAPASVQRAYTIPEMTHIITRAGYPSMEVIHHYFYRMAIVIWRKESL